MSQYDFGTIDPNTTSGTDLADLLNDWRDAVHSSHSGSSQPSYVVAGMLWNDTSPAGNANLMRFNEPAGGVNVPVFQIDQNGSKQARMVMDNDADSYLVMGRAADDVLSCYLADTESLRFTSTGLRLGAGAASVAVDLQDKTDAVRLPAGTTAQRPTAAVGQIRWNSSLSRYEGYNGSSWVLLSGLDVSWSVAQAGTFSLGTSRNVSSAVDVAVGTFNINFTNALSSLDFEAGATSTVIPAVTNATTMVINASSTTQVTCVTCNTDGTNSNVQADMTGRGLIQGVLA